METGFDMQTGRDMSNDMRQQMQDCIQECISCHATCLQAITYCLQMGGEHADPAHIRLLMNCAEICQVSANFMLNNSELHGLTCEVCAAFCDRCAESCFRFEEDSQMQQCARTCRSCFLACEDMAAAAMM
jgi:hypothetical protein